MPAVVAALAAQAALGVPAAVQPPAAHPSAQHVLAGGGDDGPTKRCPRSWT